MYRASGYTTLIKQGRLLSGLVAVLVLTLSNLFVGLSFAQEAGSARLYLRPSSANVTTGKNVTLDIRVDSGSGSGVAIEVYGSYDQAKLQFVAIDASGSAFDSNIDQSGGNGTFSVARFAFGQEPSGDVLVARVTFKTLTNGSSTITLDSNSEYAAPGLGGETYSLQRSGATINASTPQPPPPPPPPPPDDDNDGGGGGSNTGSGGGSSSGGSSGGSSSGGTSSGGGTSPVSAGTGLSISVNPAYIGHTLANFDVSTSKKSSVSVAYGLSEDDLEFTTQPTKSNTRHAVTLDTRLIQPGKTYYYQVTARADNGAVAKSGVHTFDTLGIPLNLLVLNKDGNPVQGVTVSLKDNPDIKAATNADGYAIFDSVPGGDVTFVISPGFWQSSEHVLSLSDYNLESEIREGGGFTQTASGTDATIQLDYNPTVIGLGGVFKVVGIILGLGVLIILVLRLINMARSRMNYARTLENQSPTVVAPGQYGPTPSQQPSPYPQNQPPTTSPQQPTPPPSAPNSYPPAPGQVVQPNQNDTNNQN